MGWLIPPDWNVPAGFAKRLGDAAGRQRAMTADGHLLLVLHQPPEPTEATRKARLFWRDAEGEWRSNALGDGAQALKKHLAEFAARVEDLEERSQTAQSAEDYYRLLQTIAPLHRTTRNLHATLQQARAEMPADRELLNARDRAGEIERSLELLYADAKNGLDFTVAFQSEQEAQRAYEMAVAAHRLNLLAALFFPIATMAAIFGMNLRHGLEGWGTPFFWGVLAVGLVCGVLLAGIVARRPAPAIRPTARPKKRRR
jgi:Mg2+ and Co2+ transporter CorA